MLAVLETMPAPVGALASPACLHIVAAAATATAASAAAGSWAIAMCMDMQTAVHAEATVSTAVLGNLPFGTLAAAAAAAATSAAGCRQGAGYVSLRSVPLQALQPHNRILQQLLQPVFVCGLLSMFLSPDASNKHSSMCGSQATHTDGMF